ncbi:MAG: ABC transporter permease [Acidobacteria bacterium]|nr:ABC transporter permease [Acidobacteriota bacterium]
MSNLEFLAAHWREILGLTLEHLWLVTIAIAIASAIGIPLGILLSRSPAWRKPVLWFANIVQTVPSLALFGLLLPAPWLGERVARLAVFALALYALLPIVRNAYVGIAGIDPAVRESAIAMGLTKRQLLWHVELPLALPTLFAGLRVATVIAIGVATIAAAVGAGGLGELIFRGLAMVDNRVIFAGAIPAALLALLADGLLGLLERVVSPRRRSQSAAPRAVAA